jgi:DNA-directed RNA polymerase sigma subunit (sigma70/sigma32)
MWIDNSCNQNCVFIAIANNKCEKMTLQQIGDIHNLTRMRVCQIEKRAIEKIKQGIGNHSL